MIRTNSVRKNNKFMVPNGAVQSLSPFNSAIRLSSHQIDTPSTPQRQIISTNALRMVVNQQEVRQSTNNAFTPNGKVSLKNQENKSIIVQQERYQENQIQQILNDNQYLAQALEQAKQELRNNQDSKQLELIKSRMENLERVIEDQAQEIELWKSRQNNTQGDSMQQMESQILLVIQENERLNLLIKNIQETMDSKDQMIDQFQQEHCKQEIEMKKLKDKVKSQERTINTQKEELKQWHETFTDFEKNSKNQVNNEAELLKNKIKIQELEFQLHKRKISETGSGKQSQREDVDLSQKLRQLLDENNKLSGMVSQLQEEKSKLQPKKQQLEILKQELQRQQLFSQEELSRLRIIAQDNINLQEQLQNANEQIQMMTKSLQQLRDGQNDVSEQLFDEFLNSQNNCLHIVQQLL